MVILYKIWGYFDFYCLKQHQLASDKGMIYLAKTATYQNMVNYIMFLWESYDNMMGCKKR